MSAELIVATIYWNTEADGTPVDPATPLAEGPRCHYGPFATEAEAAAWLTDEYPDGDTDVADDCVETVPAGTVINEPSIITPTPTGPGSPLSVFTQGVQP